MDPTAFDALLTGGTGLLTLLVSVGVTYGVMRTKMNAQGRELAELKKSIEAAWLKIEMLVTDQTVFDSKQRVISNMLQPDKVAEFNKSFMGVQKDVEYLRRDVDELRELRKAGLL